MLTLSSTRRAWSTRSSDEERRRLASVTTSPSEDNYVHDSRAPLDERGAELTKRASEARAEARHAREHPGLNAAARIAASAAEELEAEAASLREVAVRVDRGYAWWDQSGFELALEAYGEPWSWVPVSESVTEDFTFSHDDAYVRIPVEVQRAYGRAFESRFFNRFDICCWFETEGDDVVATHYYLFGTQDFPRLGACSFFIEQWGDANAG